MATLLFSDAVATAYKEVSEVINSVQPEKQDIRKKSMREIMNESFFHGASRFGDNFIA
ncbi:hypothetical protein SDC9_190760 [bioreactor metagenome]|uniref:Uncharacterized protein n=1 Tax=bioreactor metagenome TaxID=1076179 RepID=A0A645HVW7_9ZZZZ